MTPEPHYDLLVAAVRQVFDEIYGAETLRLRRALERAEKRISALEQRVADLELRP
jgi:hypothetical protein